MAEKQNILERPRSRAKTIGLVLAGKSDSQVATVMGVSRQAVTKFRHRHADEIVPAVEQLHEAIIDVALKDKEARIRELAWLYGLARDEVEAFGITLIERRIEGRGESMTEIQTRDFRAPLVKEMRGLLDDIAEELNERSADDKTNIDRTFVLIRERIIEQGQHLEPLG